MIDIAHLTDWLAEHGYRDQYPRRDAMNPDAMFWIFVKDGRRRLGVRAVKGRVRRSHFEKIKQTVAQDEEDDRERP